MKKWLSIISMGVIIASLTACGSGESGKADQSTTKEGKTVLTLSLLESSPFYKTLEKSLKRNIRILICRSMNLKTTRSIETQRIQPCYREKAWISLKLTSCLLMNM